MLVLLHGLGSNEADLFSFAPELDPRLTVVSLRAPKEYAYGGYAWFDIVWSEEGLSFEGDEVLQTLELLCREVEDLQREYSVEPDRTVIGGFSQGAMMSLGVLLRSPDLVGGALLLSGCMVPGLPADGGQITQPIFQSHGKFDDVLPIQLGREVRDLLTTRGAPLAYHEYAMGHEVNQACLHDVTNWISDFVQP